MPIVEVEPIPLTAGFIAELKTKLALLLKEKKALVARVKDAREMGDLSENGAYKYGKIELGSVIKQLQQLSFLLQHGFVAEVTQTNQVEFGNTVSLQSEAGLTTYTILSEYEADVAKGSISVKSPLGLLLLGKKVGEVVVLELGKKQRQYQILSIE